MEVKIVGAINGDSHLSANSFGHLFKITSFGESHGGGLGTVIEGCPAGLVFDEALLLQWMARRRPGTSAAVSGRAESDTPEVLSGVFEGRTLGTPITVLVRNRDARSEDYEAIKNSPRPGHADDVWKEKFGHVDHRGGGRSSGRETLARVIGGAFAQMFVRTVAPEVQVGSWPRQIGPLQFQNAEQATGAQIEDFLTQAKAEGQSYGGIGEVHIQNPPVSLGQPVFRKLKSDLASAMMSIGATTGFEFGEGFASAERRGTDFHGAADASSYGGIRGGVSTGETIYFRVAFKPTSSVLDVAKKGRHDPCIVLRALPVLEAMTWLVLADHILWRRLDRI